MVKMKLWVKILLIFLACLIVAVSAAAIGCSCIAARINDKTEPIAQLSYWQSFIKDDALLRNIAMPGAHDAGTNGMIWFCETQDRTVLDQLRCGTRYFDLRPKMKDGKCLIYHGPGYGAELEGILADVSRFIDDNPSEALILDIHKFGNEEVKAPTAQMIDKYFSGKLVANNKGLGDLEFISSLTLGEVRGKALIIWGDDDEYVVNDNRYFLRNDDGGQIGNGCLQSFYTKNWNWYYSSEKYIKKAIPAYIEMYRQSVGGFFVLQCQLTDGCLIIGPRYREGQHEKNMNDWVIAAYDSEELEYINVIMRDFVSPIKNCYTIALNLQKGTVKDESGFGEMISSVVNITYGQN